MKANKTQGIRLLRAAAAQGVNGSCLVIFPASGSLIDDNFFVRDLKLLE
jgi:hypothetical protein